MISLVTGASRGIGLEITRQLSARGDQVLAVCRKPTPKLAKLNVTVIQADVTHPELEEQLQLKLQGISSTDCLINNAGVGHEMSTSLNDVDLSEIRSMLETNALGPLRVSRALLKLLKKAPSPKIAHISSLMGSIGDNQSGKAYGYRMSKAALNAMNKSLSIDEPQIISVVLHPGWVQTDMGGAQAPVAPTDSARQLITLIDQLTAQNSGRFYDYKGQELPW